MQSGTLITAKHALDQNRQLYAVPGPIYSLQSLGPNNLIKMGAKLITEPSDVLRDLNLETLPDQQTVQATIGDTKEESVLLKLLSRDLVIINELIKQSGLDAAKVSSSLTFFGNER